MKRIEDIFSIATSGRTFPDGVDKIHGNELERFAELIVRECAAIDFYNMAGFGLYEHDRASQVIKEHFGLEK